MISPDLVSLGAGAVAGGYAAYAAVTTAAGVLKRICLPAAEELGEYFKDRVAGWRAIQAVDILKRTEEKLKLNCVPEEHHAHPRLVHRILDEGTWTDDAAIQEMWAGLLSSSCTEDGEDDSNLLFTNLLGSMTKLQARIMKYGCETARKLLSPTGLISVEDFGTSAETLLEITGERDIHRLDRELDHMRQLGLFANYDGGLYAHAPQADVTPSPLALNMYVRCSGSRKSPIEFFGLDARK